MSPNFRSYLGKEKKLRTKRASVSPLVSLPQDQKSVIERVRQDTASICENRSLQLGLTANADEQASSENYSIFDSTFGDEIFSFDDEIVNSFAYRNALKRLASKKKATQQNKKPDEHHILDEPLIDLEGPSETNNGPRIKFTVTSNYPCLTPSKPFTHTVDLSDTVAEDLKSLLPNSVASPIQQRNERHAHFTSPSYSGGNPNNTSANQSDKSRDGKKGIGQVFGAGRSDVLRSSMLSKKESSSLHDEEKKRAKSVIEQAVPDDSRIAFPFPRILSVNGNINTYHSNGARVDLGSTQAKTEAPHDYAASRRRRWIERSLGAIPSSSPILGLKSLDDGKYGGQYGHESRTKASEDEGIFCDKPITEHDYTNDEIIEYDRASKEAVKNIEMKPRRKTSQGQQSGLRAYASLVDNSATKGGDGVASKSSINANLRLLETVENSIRRLIMPELETLRQEQRKEQSSQTPEPSHRGSRASPVTNANLSHKSSKYASDSDASEDLELSRDEDKSDVCEDVDLTTDIPRAVERTSNSIAEDGKPVTIPTRKRRSSRDKSRGDCDLTHGLQRSQTSLLIEYFEGGRGTDSHSRPSVKVKLSSARISRSKT